MNHNNNFYQRGDIIYADLGQNAIGLEQKGSRPCLIVSNTVGNKFSGILTVAPITSKVKTNLPTHVYLHREDSPLKHDSIILTEQIRCIDKKRVTGYVGSIKKEQLNKVNDALRASLGLNNYYNKLRR